MSVDRARGEEIFRQKGEPPILTNKTSTWDIPLHLVHNVPTFGGWIVVYVFLPNASQPRRWGVCACDLSPVSEVRDKRNCMLRKARHTRCQGTRRKQQDTNEPDRRGASCNRVLRIPRTEPHSRRRLLPDRANRCCKTPLLGSQGERGVQRDSANAETSH